MPKANNPKNDAVAPKSSDMAKSAASRLGIRQDDSGVNFDAKSLSAAVGGWWGIIEAVVPATAFVLVFAWSAQVLTAVIVAAVFSVFFIARQFVLGKPVTQAIAGAVGIAIAAYLPLRPGGEARDYFVPGFFTNLGYGSVLLISMMVRWPLIGVLVGLLKGVGTAWRSDKALLGRFTLVTGLWVALFASRLLVQVPLYFANNVEALGLARVIMGVPSYALCLWLSWLLLRAVIMAKG